jgi:DNA-binding CsgD family transcriptional regulator
MVPQKLIELVRSTADAAFAVDGDGDIVAWNATASLTFGIQEQEAVGRRCGDMLQGADECGPVCSADCTIRQSVRARRPVRNFDLLVATPMGRRWFNISVLIYSDPGSPDSYALHVARPVDTRKRLEMVVRDFVRGESIGEEALASPSISRAVVGNAPLSDREVDVLRLLGRGFTTTEVARSLSISRTTVNNHVQHAMAKLDAHTRLEAIRKAEFAGLI